MEEAKRCPHCMAENTPDAAVCTRCGAEMGARNAPHQLPVGAVLAGRYRVGCCIGEGGFGITYAGWDETLDMKVAVKEYYPAGNVNRYNTQSLSVEATGAESSAFFERGKKRFLDEARTLAKFAYSANIVGVRDCFFENNTAYIVMEFLEGESLSQYLREHGPMPFAQALALLDPVMAALEGIHAKGLIHRDISPSNLMLLDGGGVKLLDFGTARDASPAGERSLSVVLKPGYAPEEQYTTRGAQGPWSDVYAMSATLYRMITGQTPENALNRMPSDPLPAPSALGADIAPAQERALLHGMAIHASSRIQSMAELRTALRDGEAAPASEPEDEERTIYCPQMDNAAVPDVPVQAERESVARDERTQRTVSGAPAERKTAREPEKTVGTAVQDVPPQPVPELSTAAPAEAPTEPPKVKKRREKAPRAKKTGKKKKKLGRIILIAAVCVLAALVVLISMILANDDSTRLTKFYYDQKITASMMRSLARDRTAGVADFTRCTFEDGTIEALAKSKTIATVRFEECSGIETLSPLANMEPLSEISYKGVSSADGEQLEAMDGAAMFPVEMNCRSLLLHRVKLTGGISFLNNFQSTEFVTFSECAGMDQLPLMPALKSLDVKTCDLSACDLSVLPQCTRLDDLALSECGLDKIDFLEGCVGLESVDISGNAITSLLPLSGCTKLKSLSASTNQLTSLEGLEDKTSLCSLAAASNMISDLTPLKNDTLLSTLTLGNNNISDLTPLSDTTLLTWFDVHNNAVHDLRPLAGNEQMRVMYLSYNQLTDFAGCENMIDLWSLIASHNQIENLDGLINVTQLKAVSLSDNRLSDISLLAKNAGKLMAVQIDDNEISNISPLAGNPDMTLVTMENNHISDISALAGMSKLRAISAYNNEITDISVLSDCVLLEYVDLGENQITDVSALVASSAEKRHLLLQNNQISDVSMLQRDTEYTYLSLYGNPIEDYSFIRELTNVFWADTLILNWTEDLNIEALGASPYYDNMCILDVPKDRQANLSNEFKAAKKAAGYSGLRTPRYLTEEEADEMVKKERQKFRIDEKLDQ